MDATTIESALLVLFFLLPIVFLVFLYVVGVMLVATAMVYVKAGRPAWLSLVPLYSFVEMLDIAGISVWWGLMVPALSALSIAGLFVCADTTLGFWISLLLDSALAVGTFGFMGYLYYYLARSFGENGWYAVGYLFLPFIFFPLLGFGTAKFKGSKKKSVDKQRNKLIITGIIAVSAMFSVAMSMLFVFAAWVKEEPPIDQYFAPQIETCYTVVGQYVQHVPSGAFLAASVQSFNELTDYSRTGNCYGEDSETAFFQATPIAGANAPTFRVLGVEGFYAVDAKRVYAGSQVVPDADPKNFTDLGYGYAKGKNTVFYVSTDTDKEWDLVTLKDADVESFETVEEWNDTYDAFDKNHRYYNGVVISTTTRQ